MANNTDKQQDSSNSHLPEVRSHQDMALDRKHVRPLSNGTF
jgi:hypothetical protein